MREDPDLTDRTTRDIGFSFAAADLLIELDQTLLITCGAGAAAQIVGREADSLAGLPFIDLVAPGDRPIVAGLLTHLTDEMTDQLRPPPVTIRLAETGATAQVGACRLPGQDTRIYLTLSTARTGGQSSSFANDRDPESGALSRDHFIVAARDLVFGARELGVSATLTLITLPDILAAQERGDVAAIRERARATVEHLRSCSLGDAVGRVSQAAFAVVHDAAVSTDTLIAPLSIAGEDAPPTRQLALRSDGLSPQDVADVISFLIAEFTVGRWQGGDVDSLSNGMKKLVRETLDRLSALKQTVFSREFDIVFQPIVSLGTEAVHHYEVLSRFPDGDAPERTVAFAESTGLIEDLDLAVCKKAIDVLRDRAENGATVSLAVNISARSLRSNILVSALDQLLSSLGRLRGNLMLEITETDRIEDLQLAENVLQHFRRSGNPVCLDDFGAGAASFQYFQALTVDYAKIDGSYVRDILVRSRDAAILRAMVSLCRDLGVHTVAEMVERRDQASMLETIGIDYGQGWLFGRPLPSLAAEPPV